MIRNQRPYQLMYSKTGNKTISLFVAVCARICGRLGFLTSGLKRRDEISLEHMDTVRAELKEICPKPESNAVRWKPMQEIDKKIDLSVIVPAHNVERYIEECVTSILSQKSKYNMQIILVNDGSTDRTLELLKNYQNIPEILVIDLQNGGSAAKARNEGILHAVGQYLMFIDSDDRLCPGAVEYLMRTAQKENADIVQGSWQYIDESGNLGPIQQYENMLYTGKNRKDCLDLPGMPWGKVYRRELFSDIRFPSNYTCFEDTIIHFLIFRKAQKIISIGETVYLWRKNPTGITSTNQGRLSAIQSYWIMEELLEWDKKLMLPHDDLFVTSLIMQLSNYCYANLRGLDCKQKKNVFRLCCLLYQNYTTRDEKIQMPYAVLCGEKALREKRYDLWCSQGRLFQLMN